MMNENNIEMKNDIYPFPKILYLLQLCSQLFLMLSEFYSWPNCVSEAASARFREDHHCLSLIILDAPGVRLINRQSQPINNWRALLVLSLLQCRSCRVSQLSLFNVSYLCSDTLLSELLCSLRNELNGDARHAESKERISFHKISTVGGVCMTSQLTKHGVTWKGEEMMTNAGNHIQNENSQTLHWWFIFNRLVKNTNIFIAQWCDETISQSLPQCDYDCLIQGLWLISDTIMYPSKSCHQQRKKYKPALIWIWQFCYQNVLGYLVFLWKLDGWKVWNRSARGLSK